MISFKIKLANRIIAVNTIHTRTRALCRDFIADGVPEFEISIEQSDIDLQKEIFLSNIERDIDLWDGLVEVSVVARKICEKMIEYNTFMFHGAAIALNNKGYIFSGNSGVGKSTHILHWVKNQSDTMIVNGDKPFVQVDSIANVYGSPWAGKEILYTNTVVPLKAIIMMERNDNNNIYRISFAEAFPKLLEQSFYPKDESKMRKTLQLLKSLDGKVEFYRFLCNNFKEDCFETAYKGIVLDNS